MATQQRSDVSEYLEMPYEVAVVRRGGEDGMRWSAQVVDLPGCEARARTEAEAVAAARAAMADWIADALEHDRPIPPPREAATHSGRLLVRMPQTLHGDLARIADRENVSLNALIIGILGGAVAWRQPPAPASRSVGDAPEAGEAPAPPESPAGDLQPDRARFLTAALRVNVVVVAIVGLVAVALLVAALTA
jgi:predicted RNase H-like HicB family nuclease